jgi:hypothetical protein
MLLCVVVQGALRTALIAIKANRAEEAEKAVQESMEFSRVLLADLRAERQELRSAA